jgi:plasmid stabilization system protein ParE
MAERYHVIIEPRASRDLISIYENIEKNSPQNANSIAQAIFDAIDSLEFFPRRYKVHRRRRNPKRVVRSMPVPPFIVYYRVLERNQSVQVLTVRHGAQERPAL